MAYADAADRYTGETPVIVLELVIGASTYSWCTDELWISTSGSHLDPRILNPGRIDRSLESAPVATGDLTMLLDNTDGTLDQFVTNYTSSTQNIVRGVFTVYRTFQSEGEASSTKMATFHFGRFSFNRDRTATLDLYIDRAMFGNLLSYTVEDVVTALRADHPTRFGTGMGGADVQVKRGTKDAIVPHAFGSWNLNHERDGLDGIPAFDFGGSFGQDAITTPRRIHVVALNPYGFDASAIQKYLPLNSDGSPVMYEGRKFFRPLPDLNYTDFEVVSLASLGNGGLEALLLGTPNQTSGGFDGFRIPVHTSFSDIVTESLPMRPGQVIQAIVQELGDANRWNSTYVDTNSFNALNVKTADLAARGLIRHQISDGLRRGGDVTVLDVVDEIARSFSITLFITKGGKLAAHTINPEGGSAEYSSALSFTEDDDFLGASGAATADMNHSRFGIVNDAVVDMGPNYRQLTRPAEFPSWNVDSVMTQRSGVAVRSENSTSQTNHNQVFSREIFAPWAFGYTTARGLAHRITTLQANPRVVLEVLTSWRATQLELGDTVKITEGAVPGWSADRLCIVDGMVDDLANHTVHLTLVDYDDLLGAKVYILSSEVSWLVKSQGGGETVDFTASSATVTANGWNPSTAGVLAGDIFSRRGWPDATLGANNNFNCVVNAVSSTTITLESGGGEDGSLPDANETSAADWRIYRGQANRSTTGGSYSTAVNAKYGVLCGSDGLFRDDATSGFKYGAGV